MTYAQIVEKFIGSNNFDGTLAEQGAREVIDILPKDYLVQSAGMLSLIVGSQATWFHDGGSIYTHDSAGGPHTKRILEVFRNNGTEWRPCEKVSQSKYRQAENTNSIYSATEYSPIYILDSSSYTGYMTLKVLPGITGSLNAADSARVYYVPYVNFTNSEDGSVDSWDYIDPHHATEDAYKLFEVKGFSRDTVNIMALKGAIYIMQSLISDAVQDDEDTELLNLLNPQLASLNAQYEMDMKRIVGANS